MFTSPRWLLATDSWRCPQDGCVYTREGRDGDVFCFTRTAVPLESTVDCEVERITDTRSTPFLAARAGTITVFSLV